MPVPHHSSFLQAGCPSYRPTNSVKALKAKYEGNLAKTDIINKSTIKFTNGLDKNSTD